MENLKENIKIIKDNNSKTTTIEIYKWVMKPILKEKTKEYNINSLNDKTIDNFIQEKINLGELF